LVATELAAAPERSRAFAIKTVDRNAERRLASAPMTS
jgi:hypothetical protein